MSTSFDGRDRIKLNEGVFLRSCGLEEVTTTWIVDVDLRKFDAFYTAQNKKTCLDSARLKRHEKSGFRKSKSSIHAIGVRL